MTVPGAGNRSGETKIVDISIDQGVITSITPTNSSRVLPSEKIIEGERKLALPGLINAHSHSPLSAVKGAFDRLNHKAMLWAFQAYTAGRTSREIYVSTLLNCIEMLKTGTTSVVDHFPEQLFTEEDVEAVVSAYRDSGMRVHIALRVFDEKYDDIFPENQLVDPRLQQDIREKNPFHTLNADKLINLCEGVMKTWNDTSKLISLGPAPSNPIRCSDHLLIKTAELSETFNVPLHCHLLETNIQARLAQKKYGQNTIKHLDQLGFLTHRTSCAHTIWVDEEEIQILADRGTSVVHNPESNLRSGAGKAPIPKMLERGVNVAIGTDGTSSSGSQILQQAMKLATIIHRDAEQETSKWISSEQAFVMGTHAGAIVLGKEENLGSIVVGSNADIVLYDLGEPAWTPMNDPINQFVQSENGSGVHTVLINGEIVLENKKIKQFDETGILAEAKELIPNAKTRNRDLFSISDRMRDEVN